jgi:hypothetical protein
MEEYNGKNKLLFSYLATTLECFTVKRYASASCSVNINEGLKIYVEYDGKRLNQVCAMHMVHKYSAKVIAYWIKIIGCMTSVIVR